MTTYPDIVSLLPLDRPEYPKQAESLLTDLLWRSAGSNLAETMRLSRSKDELLKLVPLQIPQGRKDGIRETQPIALQVDLADMVALAPNEPSPIPALLNSITAPKARGDRSIAYVPIHKDIVAFQTLHGLVNKAGPPNLARIIERVGWLGGAEGNGEVVGQLLQVMNTRSGSTKFAAVVDSIIPVLASRTWANLRDKYDESLADWPNIARASSDTRWGISPFASQKYTPFHWFWEKWQRLCDPANEWFEALPPRRFMDWSMCVLRTGLSFTYLWEADFYLRLYSCIGEALVNR